MKNSSLFDDVASPLKPSPDRTEPDFWVRTVAILDRLESGRDPIRTISFEPGINIIRTAKPGPGETRTVGHSVGKTLLVRLIRYCLGEAAFCTREVRQAIADRLPDAYVVAEIVARGELWTVARPMGMGAAARSCVIAGGNLDVLLSEVGARRRYAEFVAMMRAATALCFSDLQLEHAGRRAQWLDLLAWVARDQDCRFRHHHEWRDSDSGSGTKQLQRVDASLVIRMVMGLLDDEERRLRVSHNQLNKEKARLTTEESRRTTFLDGAEAEFRRWLRISADAPAGQLFGPVAVDRAKAKRDQLKRLLKDTKDNSPVPALEDEKTVAANAEAVAQAELTRLQGLYAQAQIDLKQEEEASTEDYQAAFAQQAQWCDYYTTREEAKAANCPATTTAIQPGERDPHREQRVQVIRARLQKLETQITTATEQVDNRKQAHTQATANLDSAREEHEKRVAGLLNRISRYETVRQQAERYEKQWREVRAIETRLKATNEALDRSSEAQKAARSKLQIDQGRLSNWFDHSVKVLLGSEAGGYIEIDGRGIHPHLKGGVAASGQALGTSATVLGFDMACLIASVCGLGQFPRLLIHDSPREADMEEPMYHRLFQLVAELEASFGGRSPSFQYIMTTTTPPPAIIPEDRIRLTLDARDDDGLLLRTRL